MRGRMRNGTPAPAISTRLALRQLLLKWSLQARSAARESGLRKTSFPPIFSSVSVRSVECNLSISPGQVKRHHGERAVDVRYLVWNPIRHHDPIALADFLGNAALNRGAAQVRLICALFFNELSAGDDRARS